MKSLFNLLFISTIILIASCKQPKKPIDIVANTQANVAINFINQAGGVNITEGPLNYTNSAGNLYSVDLLKYYVTNVVLIKDDGSEFKLNNYDLINAFDANYSKVNAVNVPNGTYTSMKFYLGVDPSRNHSGAQDGDLDPKNNMIWTWSTGYIFFKHEGFYKDLSGTNTVIQFHLGTDAALSTVQIPISLSVAGENKTMNIVFDLNKMYNSPMLDFNLGNIYMSDGASDSKWISDMVNNTNDAFSFKNVE
jgi:hypothetical protein